MKRPGHRPLSGTLTPLALLLAACAGKDPGRDTDTAAPDPSDTDTGDPSDTDSGGPEPTDVDGDADASTRPGAEETCGDGVVNDYAGLALAATGALDGSGGGDLLIGAASEATAGERAGAAYLLRGVWY